MGGQADQYHLAGAGELYEYDDGSLLQPKAADLLPKGGHPAGIAALGTEVTAAQGDSI